MYPRSLSIYFHKESLLLLFLQFPPRHPQMQEEFISCFIIISIIRKHVSGWMLDAARGVALNSRHQDSRCSSSS